MPVVTFERTVKTPTITAEVYHVIDSNEDMHHLELNAGGVGELNLPAGQTILTALLLGSNGAKVSFEISGVAGPDVSQTIKIHRNNRIFTHRTFAV